MRLDYQILLKSLPNLTVWIRPWFARNAEHGFNSGKLSNLAWSTSSNLTIYFSVLPLSDRQRQICLFAKNILTLAK